MPDYDAAYLRLHELYIRLWEHIDQFFEDSYSQAVSPPREPGLRPLVRSIRQFQELVSLGRREPPINTLQRYQKLSEEFMQNIESVAHELTEISEEEKETAFEYIKRVKSTIEEYTEMKPDWFEKAKRLKTELTDKVLEISDKVYLGGDPWKDR